MEDEGKVNQRLSLLMRVREREREREDIDVVKEQYPRT